jgi:hypothetical protein
MIRSPLSRPKGWSERSFARSKSFSKDESIGNRGTEFWLLMERNFDGTEIDNEGDQFVDITSQEVTSGTVEIEGLGYSKGFTTTPGEVTRIRLPDDAEIESSEEVKGKGIHITAENPVTVYGLSRADATTDGYLGLPVSVLSTNYLVASYPSYSAQENLSQFAFVSPRDGVSVTVTPSAATLGGRSAGETFTVELDKGEVYQVRSETASGVDLTSSVVQASSPVALFSGHSCTNVPSDVPYCDILIEQIPPNDTWGSSFVTRPLEGRENGDTFRILSGQENTTVEINGESVATLGFGDYHETILEQPSVITASNPVLVMQYSNGDEWDPEIDANGDPFMMMVPPSEQFSGQYAFATPDEGFSLNYVNLAVPSDATESILVDGSSVENSLFETVGGSDFSVVAVDVELGSHTAESTSDTQFGIYSYGFEDDDSYGFTGGLTLDFISEGSAPEVTRTPETIELGEEEIAGGQSITISAEITDPAPPLVQSATVFYRNVEEDTYSSVSMTNAEGNTWEGTIPGESVSDPGVEYYISATDGQLTGTSPQVNPSSTPYSIAILPNEVPTIEHTPVNFAPPGEDITIEASVTDNTDQVSSVELFYRKAGGNPAYTTLEMQEEGVAYIATIPGVEATEQGLEYYIRATDNFGVSTTEGTPDQPIGITVSDSPPGELEFGPLTLTADQIQEVESGVYEASGNVTINQVLHFGGTVTADTEALKIEGNGQVYLTGIPDRGQVALYDGDFTFQLLDASSSFLKGTALSAANNLFAMAGLPVELDGVEVLSNGVRVEGMLKLPEVMGFFKTDITTLQITESSGVDLTGEVEVGEVALADGVATLKELSLEFNTAEQNFIGEAELDTPPVSLDAGAEVLGGELDAVEVEIGVDPPVPLGTTGLGLAGGGGFVDGLANPPPLELGLMADLKPVTGSLDFVKLDDLTLSYTFDTQIEGSGRVTVFGTDVGGARLTIIPSSKVEFDGKVKLIRLSGDRAIVRGNASMSLSKGYLGGGLRLSGQSRAKVIIPQPSELPYLGGFPFNAIPGLPVDFAGIRNNFENTKIWGEVNPPVLPLCAYNLEWTGSSLEAGFCTNLNPLNFGLFQSRYLMDAPTLRKQSRFEGRSLIVSPNRVNNQLQVKTDAMDQRFTLNRSTSAIVIRVEGPEGAPAYDLTLPSGVTYTPQTTDQRPGATFYANDDVDKGFYTIENPPQGTYTIGLSDQQTYQIDVFGANNAPFIEVGHSGIFGEEIDVSYQATDPDDEAEIRLFYDNDNQGQNGVLIEEGLSAQDSSYTWNTEDLPTGTYYIYATASDGKNAPSVDYAEDPITVVADGAPAAPEELDAVPQDTTIELGWNAVPDADTYTLYYNRSGQPLNSTNAQAFGVGDTTAFSFEEIAPGRTYRFAVTAVDTTGRESARSNVAEVDYVSDTENNAPTIAGREPPSTARVGIPYSHELEVTDPDGDALDYILPSAPDGMSVTSNGQLQWTPSQSGVGVYRVKVVASDGNGERDSLAYRLTALDEQSGRGTVAFTQPKYVGYGERGAVTLADPGLNVSPSLVDSHQVQIHSRALPGGSSLEMVETSANSGEFSATFRFGKTEGGKGILPVQEQDSLWMTYDDAYPDETVVAISSFLDALRPTSLSYDISRSFNEADEKKDYRLVALPGQASGSLSESVSGDWRGFQEDGRNEDQPYSRSECEGDCQFGPGEGFWLITDQSWEVNQTVSTVPLSEAKTAQIDLQEGWNIVSNPFGEEVAWNRVQVATGTSQPLWQWDGSWSRVQTFAAATAGEAYYFRSDSLSQLTVPYPVPEAVPQTKADTAESGRQVLTLSAVRGDRRLSTIEAGVRPDAKEGLDPFDQYGPPGYFGEATLRLIQKEKGRRRVLATEYTPPDEEGTAFDLILQAKPDTVLTLQASGLGDRGRREAVLVNQSTSEVHDLMGNGEVTVVPQSEETSYRLLVGSSSFVKENQQAITPESVKLLANYPNPFRTGTTIEYALPKDADVRLAVYDVLGRQVAVLEEGRRESGFHRVRWDVGDQALSSGVYFYRLRAGEKTKSGRMVLLR